jgi:hypothetical protein
VTKHAESTTSCSRVIEVKEIVYQAVPYAGMAKVFDFIHGTNDVLACTHVYALLGIFTCSLEGRGSAEMSDLALSRILRDRQIACGLGFMLGLS